MHVCMYDGTSRVSVRVSSCRFLGKGIPPLDKRKMYCFSRPNEGHYFFPLSLNTQVVFHSAKREEIRRMISVMDIANMLQRIRDTFVVAKDSLLSDDGALSHCLANDVETITRQVCHVFENYMS